jgi:dihydrofolate reductase
MRSGILAIDKNYGIGKDGKLPWYIPEDLAFFKETTSNATCVMGRHTYQEIYDMRKDKPVLLPKRESLVLTKHLVDIHSKDTKIFTNKENLKQYLLNKETSIFFIGGTQLFHEVIEDPMWGVNHFYITFIKNVYDCDVFFDFDHFSKVFKETNVILETDSLKITSWQRI